MKREVPSKRTNKCFFFVTIFFILFQKLKKQTIKIIIIIINGHLNKKLNKKKIYIYLLFLNLYAI